MGLVSLGFHFGPLVICFVEVACVRTSLTACLAHRPPRAQPLTLTHAIPALLISQSCASIPELPWV